MVAPFLPSKILPLDLGNSGRHMGIITIFYLIWSLQVNVTKTFSQENYEEFTITICEGECKKLNCPSNTVIRMQKIHLMNGHINAGRCITMKRNDFNLNEEDNDNYCNQMLQIKISEKTNSECTNKSDCSFCHRREFPERYERCKNTIATSLTYICVSDQIFEEIVPSNTYVDLSCANFIEHRIIIQKAHLIPNKEETKILEEKNNFKDNKTCSITDVTFSLNEKCSRKYKCQAGPNSFLSKGCNSKKLQFAYSCVPESILKVSNTGFRNTLVLGSKIYVKNNNPILDDPIVRIKNKRKKKLLDREESWDYLWLICLFAIISVIVITFIIFIYCCRSRQHLRQTSLSNKIKLANFSPPPTSIDKIEIDLTSNNPMLPDPTISFHSHIRNDILKQYQKENSDIDFWNNTLYPKDHINSDLPSSSLSAGSSGQMSAYHSDTSKSHPNTVFNYITREKCPPDQTPL